MQWQLRDCDANVASHLADSAKLPLTIARTAPLELSIATSAPVTGIALWFDASAIVFFTESSAARCIVGS